MYDISQELFTCTSMIYNNDPITQLTKATVLKEITWQSAQPMSFYLILESVVIIVVSSVLYTAPDVVLLMNIIQKIRSCLISYFISNHDIYSPAAVSLTCSQVLGLISN